MKKLTYLLIVLLTMTACKDKKEATTPIEENVETPVVKPKHPENLVKVFDAHGGLETWKDMRTLEFSIEKADGYEITTTDLKERYALIEMPKFNVGFDGESVWVKSDNDAKFDVDPKRYYNMMFYFYAMPFVLADDGITYSDAEALTVEGITYPGIKISYDNGIGNSSNDEYILYYDSVTNKMAWLGYTKTFGTKDSTSEWSFIKYGSWQEVDGLMLPETLQWFNVENNLPTTLDKELKFSNISLSHDKMDLRMYMMPEGAEAIQ